VVEEKEGTIISRTRKRGKSGKTFLGEGLGQTSVVKKKRAAGGVETVWTGFHQRNYLYGLKCTKGTKDDPHVNQEKSINQTMSLEGAQIGYRGPTKEKTGGQGQAY